MDSVARLSFSAGSLFSSIASYPLTRFAERIARNEIGPRASRGCELRLAGGTRIDTKNRVR